MTDGIDTDSASTITDQTNYQCKYPAFQIPGLSILSSPEYLQSLRERVSDIDNKVHDQLILAYFVYRSQCEKLQVEAQDVAADFDIASSGGVFRKGLDVEVSKATAEADEQRKRKRKEFLKTVQDMINVCMARLQVLGTETFEDMEDLLQKDIVGDVAAQEIYASDEVVREHVAELWKTLDHDWERSLRLRLIWLIVTNKSIAEEEMDDLEDSKGYEGQTVGGRRSFG